MQRPFWRIGLDRLLQLCNNALIAEFLQESCKNVQKKKPDLLGEIGLSLDGLAVTYFRMRMHTIIGANPFHGPVRDGKEWFQVAIAAT